MDFSFIPLAFGELISATTAAYALAALGLAIHFGFGGLLNLGQAGFMAVGAYAFAITSVKFGWPLGFALLAAVVAAVVFALILGIPTLRLRADYFSIVTISAAEIIRLGVKTEEVAAVTGGNVGINGSARTVTDLNPIPDGRYGFAPLIYSDDQLWLLIVSWSVVALACLVAWAALRSPWGRVVKSIREDEDAVTSLGKNVFAVKIQVLIFGGVLGAIAGILFVLPRSVQADNFSAQTTFFLLAIVLLGGSRTVLGPIVGAMVFWFTLSITDGVISLLVQNGLVPLSTQQAGQIRFILVGVALVLLVIYRPQGIVGRKVVTHV